MAGDWIKVEKDTPEKPEIMAISEMLNLDPEIVFSKCFKVWRWADSMSPDGGIRVVNPGSLDALVHSPGFCHALIAVGWLQVRDSSLVIPNFNRHMGQAAKKRAIDMSKKRKKRGCGLSPPQGDTMGTNVRQKSDQSKSKRKRKREIQIPLPPLPEIFSQRPEFLSLWERWLAHRKEKNSPLTAVAATELIEQLQAMGYDRAFAAMKRSLSNGWSGIHEDKEQTKASAARLTPDEIAERM